LWEASPTAIELQAVRIAVGDASHSGVCVRRIPERWRETRASRFAKQFCDLVARGPGPGRIAAAGEHGDGHLVALEQGAENHRRTVD